MPSIRKTVAKKGPATAPQHSNFRAAGLDAPTPRVLVIFRRPSWPTNDLKEMPVRRAKVHAVLGERVVSPAIGRIVGLAAVRRSERLQLTDDAVKSHVVGSKRDMHRFDLRSIEEIQGECDVNAHGSESPVIRNVVAQVEHACHKTCSLEPVMCRNADVVNPDHYA